jgi:hypothetical protein
MIRARRMQFVADRCRAGTMWSDAEKPNAPRGLRIAGISIMITAAAAQVVLIGIFWWKDPVSPGLPMYIKFTILALTGWCLAGVALLLARYVTPYIAFILPGGLVAGSLWMVTKLLEEEGRAYWPPDVITPETIALIAGMLIALAAFYLAPAAGAWLVGYDARRRRRSQARRMSPDVFD